jgi:hypothetical protein
MKAMGLTQGCAPIAGFIALALAAGTATAQLSLDRHTIDGGGYAFSTGGGLSLGGTVGQPDAGTLTGGTLSLAGGFWLGGNVVSGVPGLPTDPPGGPPGDPPAGSALPGAFQVAPAWPNPFSASMNLGVDLPEAAPLVVRVFAPSGRLVTELCATTVPPGHHRLSWNGADAQGSRVASGVYLVLVQSGMREQRQRIVLIH